MKWLNTAVKSVIKYVEKRMEPLTDPLANVTDYTKQRTPPALPTSLDFPVSPKSEDLGPLGYSDDQIYELYRTIHKTGPTLEHLRALSLNSCLELKLDKFLPSGFLPDDSWRQDPATTGGSNEFPATLPTTKTLSNGIPEPGHEAYYKLAKELLYANEDGFAAIQKKPSPGQVLVRVAVFRKFWDGLLQMAMYWDTSLDNYIENEQYIEPLNPDIETEDQPKTKLRTLYAGRRIGTGRDMPPRFRDDTVFAFVEAITLVFRCRVERPRAEPKVKLQNLLIPLSQTGVVYRSPQDRAQARKGMLEGPLIALHCDIRTTFRRPGEAKGEGQSEIATLLREVGLMLSIAQKRARDGQEEPKPGEGKWWVTKPRWGGGVGGEVETSEENDDATECSSKGRKRSKKSEAVENWKKLEPPPSRWDKNVVHLQIGKDKSSDFDDVSFHHIIRKML